MNFARTIYLTDTVAIARLIEPAAKALGFDLVRVAMIGGTTDPTLQVMAERPDTRQLSIDDCAELSRKVSDILDAEEEAGRDPISEAYRLEVSSPGIDRPLTRPADYADWAGHEARLRYAEPVDGAKQVSGIIEGIEGGTIRVTTPKGERQVAFANIASAKLMLTDKLIHATAPLSIEGVDTIEADPHPGDEVNAIASKEG
ncbi:ribosome maturation protein RimP [Sphingomonas sp.]|uniref:ribosome maturation protein RimP n=1 Tax=Sphingomonas sp. TaxID=28214 RepID=UPI0025E92D69|nr:ribosome maturation protein RimP [Sphingomonas sp.]